MKYIRTADGRIIDTEKEYQLLQWAEQARDYALTIAQADTIEELCDLWICIDLKDNKQDVSFDFNDFEIELESKEYIIYGAILNIEDIDNPILKIVAKTNEKGELELI